MTATSIPPRLFRRSLAVRRLGKRQGFATVHELVPPMRLAELAVDAGLSKWIEDKVS
jgi:hypothetical protein